MARLAPPLLLAVVLAAPALSQAPLPDVPDLDSERYTLDNGLTLLVHQDHKAPIVAVNVWYHVGAKDEPDGRSGFAHFFEHIMFNGSEHYDQDYFQAVLPIGATTLNGTTNYDRTKPPKRPRHRPRPRPLARVRPDGPPPRRRRLGHGRGATRRRPEREAPARGRPVRPRLAARPRRHLPRGPPLPPDHHRVDGRPRGG